MSKNEKVGKISDKRLRGLSQYCAKYGAEQTAIHYGLKLETLNRYLRESKKRNINIEDSNRWLREIRDNFTDEELRAIATGGRVLPGVEKVPIISFEGQRIRIGAMTDTHIGSKYSKEERIYQAFDEFKKEKVDFIVHSGDVTEGMSHRPGHIYELDALGYDQQKEKVINVFGQWSDTDIYAIDGNHDRWFIKSNGAYVVKDISNFLGNFHYLGQDEGDISLKGKATLKLWHGEDGNSYALSYRLQKIIESLSGGEKPDALICGHTHKYVKIFERNIYTISVGTMQQQTKWMRGKRIAAHTGFSIIDLWVNEKGICKLTDTWYPFFI